MIRIYRVAAMLTMTGAVSLVASAQTPPPSAGLNANERIQATAKAASAGPTQARRKSIVQHYPYPYPEYYHGDQTAGYRNPGGTGRYLEYYPPGNHFQERGDPVRVAKFDQGGGAPDRAEQLAAQQIGVQKDQVMLNHIDNYARPAYGYGFGAGYFGGFY